MMLLRNIFPIFVADVRHAGERMPKREIFSPTWYRIFSESYRSCFSPGVMETFYLLSTFVQHESASVCQRIIQAATLWILIRLNSIFLGQNVSEGTALASPIGLNDIFLRTAAFKGSTSGQLMCLNGMLLYQTIFNPLH
jgi:hypothetical protein